MPSSYLSGCVTDQSPMTTKLTRVLLQPLLYKLKGLSLKRQNVPNEEIVSYSSPPLFSLLFLSPSHFKIIWLYNVVAVIQEGKRFF